MNKKRLSSIAKNKQPLKARSLQSRPHLSKLNKSRTPSNFQPTSRKSPVVNLIKSEERQYTKKTNRIRPMIVASGSAVLIGVILGFIMLNMFTQLGEHPNQQGSHVDAIGLANDSNGKEASDLQISETEKVTSTIEAINGFVLQAGVFSTRENAESWATNYEEHGFSTVIWERDQQFFLLIGFAQTEEQASELVAELEQYQLEVFVKAWATPDMEIQATELEIEWLSSLNSLWKDLIVSASAQGSIDTQEWKNLLVNIPDHHTLDPFQNVLNVQIGQKDQLERSDMQQLILEIWHAYERFGQNHLYSN